VTRFYTATCRPRRQLALRPAGGIRGHGAGPLQPRWQSWARAHDRPGWLRSRFCGAGHGRHAGPGRRCATKAIVCWAAAGSSRRGDRATGTGCRIRRGRARSARVGRVVAGPEVPEGGTGYRIATGHRPSPATVPDLYSLPPANFTPSATRASLSPTVCPAQSELTAGVEGLLGRGRRVRHALQRWSSGSAWSASPGRDHARR